MQKKHIGQGSSGQRSDKRNGQKEVMDRFIIYGFEFYFIIIITYCRILYKRTI